MIYFTSDTRLGYGNIIKYCHRPFLCEEDLAEFNRLDRDWENENPNDRYRISKNSINMMDANIIDNINKYVGRNDVLYHLGNFAHCPKNPDGRYYANCERYRNMINCDNVYLICGDDDPMISNLFSGFYETETLRYRQIPESFYLTHYPQLVWKKSHKGSINLYGECHGEIEEEFDKILPERKSMDVGVDNAYEMYGEFRPFALQEILTLMQARKGNCFNNLPVD